MSFEVKTEWTVNPLTEAADTLKISSNYKIKNYKVLVRDDQNDWNTDTQVIGWCSWKQNKVEMNDDGSATIKASLYNESHDRIRSCKIVANIE